MAKREEDNHLHSRTRIKVEIAIGLLNGRFRIFKRPLNQKGNVRNGYGGCETKIGVKRMARLVRACFILHNILIDFQDNTEIDFQSDDNVGEPGNLDNDVNLVAGQAAKEKRDLIRELLWIA